jgi:blue copper oxidase
MVLKAVGGNGGRGTDYQTGTLLTINATQTPAPAATLPASLAAIGRLAPESAVQTRDFVLAGGGRNPTINGQSMTSMAAMMDLTNVIKVRLDTTEIWNVINRSDDSHAFHVHDVQFQILDRDGAPPAANENGWKDTVAVSPNETVRLIMHFADYADPTTPYMFHCHLLNHEDEGMMGQFLVV